MTVPLQQKTLSELPENVSVPGYDRSAITAGILHIGVGNFHRAHQAIYLDHLFNRGLAHDWGIVGAGVRPHDAAMRQRMKDQDWLTTVVELDPAGDTARVCGSMIDYIEIDPSTVVDALTRPEIRIVSLTITEGGYFVDAETGDFDGNHPEIIRDSKNPGNPETVFGMLIAGLVSRREAGLSPFTIMSCDNLPENGHITRQSVIGLAGMMSADLADWIGKNVAFPNSMVDCITPATGDRERALVAEQFGINDQVPVVCEPFRQWVLEDNFPLGRPPLEKAGVEFVENVAAFELMKLRMLNGGHAAVAYPAALLGIHYVHDAMASPLIAAFLDRLEIEEIIPTLKTGEGLDFPEYLGQIKQRFANAHVGDTIPRLCLDGSNRQPKFILPVILDRLAAGLPVRGLALEVALWCRYCAATAEDGQKIEVVDENAGQLQKQALLARDDPSAFLAMREIFGSLPQSEEFVSEFTAALKSIWKNGTTATLEAYVEGESTGDHLLRRSAH